MPDMLDTSHAASVALYDDDVSSLEDKDAAWNHHWHYAGYFESGVRGPVGRPNQ